MTPNYWSRSAHDGFIVHEYYESNESSTQASCFCFVFAQLSVNLFFSFVVRDDHNTTCGRYVALVVLDVTDDGIHTAFICPVPFGAE